MARRAPSSRTPIDEATTTNSHVSPIPLHASMSKIKTHRIVLNVESARQRTSPYCSSYYGLSSRSRR
ncbi:unnamed protein product [Acanthoscelides obtectus]|uniref:Uncharacterized protein n=1 Tax=Acanthoscelides obtectus TaxID=200917 RepID=A0A9P0KK34_ACAOB|nr:unnamed protein product [Acanthoscelides obtectus]CAK1651980.1 hypothetical protein AOBTE_LOCUS17589 [Acanthoscelides obtectus]